MLAHLSYNILILNKIVHFTYSLRHNSLNEAQTMHTNEDKFVKLTKTK